VVAGQVALLMSLLMLGRPDGTAADAPSFAELEGAYFSSMRGGCQLALHKDGAYVLRCGAQRECRGRAVPMPTGFAVLCSSAANRSNQLKGVDQQASPPQNQPPSTRDPTRGPYVVYPPGVVDDQPWQEGLWLEPVRWKPRVYLVERPGIDMFCAAVRAGVEPRTEQSGPHFLRRGDHLKRPETRVPLECRTE
jgi:hypothetical protein